MHLSDSRLGNLYSPLRPPKFLSDLIRLALSLPCSVAGEELIVGVGEVLTLTFSRYLLLLTLSVLSSVHSLFAGIFLSHLRVLSELV